MRIHSQARVFLVAESTADPLDIIHPETKFHIHLGAFQLKVELVQIESVFPLSVNVHHLIPLHILVRMCLG